MSSFYDFTKRISELKKSEDYKAVLAYFKENKCNFTIQEISSNKYLVSDLLKSLRKEGHIDHCFGFLKTYNISIDSNTDEQILSSYGWVLYDKFKSETSNIDKLLNSEHDFDIGDKEDDIDYGGESIHYDKSDTIVLIENFIPNIIKFQNEYSYSVFSYIFKRVLKYEKHKPSINYLFINHFCNLVPAEFLSTKCESFEVLRKGVKKTEEQASDKERWYSYKTKALMKLGKFDECLKISKEALDSFQKFHYSNDSWFVRRIAISKKKLGGNIDETLTELLQILKKKKEWYIQKEISEIYIEKGDIENALKFSMDGINNFGDIEFKVDLLRLIGDILSIKNENDLSFKHYCFSKLLRIKHDWKIPNELNQKITNFNNFEIGIENYNELYNELKKYWKSFLNEKQNSGESNGSELIFGEVIYTKPLKDNDGNDIISGKIESKNKKYYFRVKNSSNIFNLIKKGSKVSLNSKPAVKDGADDIAINIKFIS